ncbi:MAG TPA: hypothetical protein P5205_17845 [Candidatus Paceibacterota bacterium]|nr:hypothetical protein [Verrucomicrobiota bacterium]HSA12227.1 hypothetical protein [Candidatus Paceibacterota bacterium]
MTPAKADVAAVRLPYGVEDVLKLSRAQLSEDVTVNFIHNSGTIYNLAPKDIVYLRNEGVSDRVINTMLDQRKNVPAKPAAQTAPAGVAPAPQAPVSAYASEAPAPQYAPSYVQPAPVYVEPEPNYVPASTVYVIPYPYAGYRYPGYYPTSGGYPYYYGAYYGCTAPSVLFSFGYRGGYRGGHCGGGRYHGHH